MAAIAARGPAVDVSGTARDVAPEVNVSGRLDGSVARLDEYGHGMRATLLGDRREAHTPGPAAEARITWWVVRTLPGVPTTLRATGHHHAAASNPGGLRGSLRGGGATIDYGRTRRE